MMSHHRQLAAVADDGREDQPAGNAAAVAAPAMARSAHRVHPPPFFDPDIDNVAEEWKL